MTTPPSIEGLIERLRAKIGDIASLWSLNGSEWPCDLADEVLAIPEILEALEARTPKAAVPDDGLVCPACDHAVVAYADGRPDDLVRCGCTAVSLEWLTLANEALSRIKEPTDGI